MKLGDTVHLHCSLCFQIFAVLLLSLNHLLINYGPVEASNEDRDDMPILNDPNLEIQEIARDLDRPTTMAFLDTDDLLVLEKNNGNIRRILDGKLLEEPLLDVDVANRISRGLLGIDIAINSTSDKTYVFIYYTESSTGTDDNSLESGIGNRLYRYEFGHNTLVNPKLLLDIPAKPGPRENGGPVKVGPDGYLYLTVGDLMSPRTIMSNNNTGLPSDGTAGILRITQDGKAVEEDEELLGDSYPINLYYAYGLRNSFGIDFDPVTGYLWDTENGPEYGDEINLVEPGFNSGWMQVQGFWKPNVTLSDDKISKIYAGEIVSNFSDLNLVDFEGKGHYSQPEFAWNQTVVPTDITFIDSNRLGEEYKYDMIVGSSSGKIYHFDLSKDRRSLILEGSLSDKVSETSNTEEAEGHILASNFGLITDLAMGPDGYIYILSHTRGAIYKVIS
jgi:aldose sugar dehydrogenase